MNRFARYIVFGLLVFTCVRCVSPMDVDTPRNIVTVSEPPILPVVAGWNSAAFSMQGGFHQLPYWPGWSTPLESDTSNICPLHKSSQWALKLHASYMREIQPGTVNASQPIAFTGIKFRFDSLAFERYTEFNLEDNTLKRNNYITYKVTYSDGTGSLKEAKLSTQDSTKGDPVSHVFTKVKDTSDISTNSTMRTISLHAVFIVHSRQGPTVYDYWAVLKIVLL